MIDRDTEVAQEELIQFSDADDLVKANKLHWQVSIVIRDQRLLVFCDGEISEAGGYVRGGASQKAYRYFEVAREIHSKGGIPQAYSARTRCLYRLLGPELAERLVG